MSNQQLTIAYVVSNVAAVLLLLLSIRQKKIARILFAALFIWASWANWKTAHNNPTDYLNYSKYAVAPYKHIIEGFFAAHITELVSIIALCQLLIGLGLLASGLVVRLSCIGAILFLLAIAPLGVGSAFPFSITASIALFILFRHHFEKDILGNKWFV